MKAALRHLVRSRRRSVLAGIAVLVPVWLLVFMLAMVGGMEQGLFTSLTEYDTGHLQVRAPDEGLAGGALPLIRDPEPLVQAVEAADEVRWYTLRLELPAMAASADRSLGVMVQGVRPEEAAEISPLPGAVVEGRYLEPGDDGVVVGEELLRALGLSLGDRLTLMGAHPRGGSAVLRAPVVGVFRAPDPDLGRGLIQADLGVAQRLVRQPGAITSVAGYVSGVDGPRDDWKIQAAVASVGRNLPEGYEVLSWREIAPEIEGFLRLLRPLIVGFMAAFFVLGGLVVLNTLYLSVLERTRELGIIRAVGASRRWIMGHVMWESGILGVLGAAGGVLLGVGLVMGIQAVGGLRLPGEFEEALAAFGIESVLGLRITPLEVALSALAMVAVALAAAWYPAHRAAKLDPVETMRYDG